MSDSVLTFPQPSEESQDVVVANPHSSQEERMAILEAVIFAAEEPPTLAQLATGLGTDAELLREDLDALQKSYESGARGIELRAVGGNYRLFTKPQHHEAVKAFVKSIQPRLKLSPAALETLAVVAYRQPVTLPEIQAIRGVVSAGGVIHTLLRHNLVATAGRRKVIGRPICYKTTSEFLVHFGLSDLSELPTLKEIEDLGRAELDEDIRVAESAVDTPSETESEAGSQNPATAEPAY